MIGEQSLRIGLFTECYRPIQNGVVASLDALRAALRDRGHESVCIAPRDPSYSDAGDDIVRLPSLPLPTNTQYRLALPSLTPRAQRALAGITHVHAHSPFVTGRLALRAARDRGVPLIYTYHTRLEYYAHYAPFDARVTRASVQRFTRGFANLADTVIAPTPSAAQSLVAMGVRAPIEVIPSGIDLARFAGGTRSAAMRRELGVQSEILVLWVGRVAREKNVELALAVMAALGPRYRMAMVGGGPERAAFEALSLRLGLGSRVRFCGEMPRDRLPDAYACADVLLFTSASETQGLVLAEALAAGLPIASLDVASNREVLQDAALFAGPVPSELAAAVAAAAGLARTAGEPAVAAARFDQAGLGDQVIRLYRRLKGH